MEANPTPTLCALVATACLAFVLPARAADNSARPVLQNLNAAQQSAFDSIDPSLAAAVATARDALVTASFSETSTPADLATKSQTLAAADQALALARSAALTRLQSSTNRLGTAQIATVTRQAAAVPRGAAPAAARGLPAGGPAAAGGAPQPPARGGAAAPAPVAPIAHPEVTGMIPAGDTRIRYMGRWEVKPDSVTTVNSGSAIRFRFDGTSLKGVFQKVTAAAQIYVTIDNGPKALFDVNAEQLELAPAGLASGPHTVEIEVKDVSQNSNRWTPPFLSALIIYGYVLAPGGNLLDLGPATGRWSPSALKMEFYGDSITEGVRAISMDTSPAGSDGTRTYSYLTGLAFGANITEIGFGAQAILRGGGGGVPSATDAFPFYFAGSPRDPKTPEPEVVVVNQGTNDGGASPVVFEPAYLAFLKQIRAAYPHALIAAMRPFNGNQDATVYSAVQTLADPRVIYIDTYGWLELSNSPDYTEQPTGLHPTLLGHAKAAEKLTAALHAAGVGTKL